jgi:hypothetical protein
MGSQETEYWDTFPVLVEPTQYKNLEPSLPQQCMICSNGRWFLCSLGRIAIHLTVIEYRNIGAMSFGCEK